MWILWVGLGIAALVDGVPQAHCRQLGRQLGVPTANIRLQRYRAALEGVAYAFREMLDIVAAGQITGDSWQAYAWRWARA